MSCGDEEGSYYTLYVDNADTIIVGKEMGKPL
jgi:hypothetical protein